MPAFTLAFTVLCMLVERNFSVTFRKIAIHTIFSVPLAQMLIERYADGNNANNLAHWKKRRQRTGWRGQVM
jgi:hypothetical protein